MLRIFKSISSLNEYGRDEYGSAAYPAFPIQLAEDRESLLLRALAPGIRHDELHIVISGQTLYISGRIACASGRYLRQERPCGLFKREVDLGCLVDAARVRAELKNGLLTIALPKHQNTRPRRVKVEYGA